MAEFSRRLFLLDGMALVYRAHFAFMVRPIVNSKGMNTSAVYGFANTLIELIKNEKPTHLAVVFDTAAPTARHEAFPAYKAQREEMPEDLSLALPYVKRLIDAFHIPCLELDGYEADDIIGTLARQAEKSGDFVTYMVTPDKDFAQLVDDRTFIYKPGRQGSEHEVIDVAKVRETWGIERPEQVIDILGLWGDTSDNIPGVPGVGEKTAKSLIQQFGSVEELVARSAELKGKQKDNVAAHADQALLCKKLATILIDVPIQIRLEELKVQPMNDTAVQALLVELEFNQLGRRLFGEGFKAGRGFQNQQPPKPEEQDGAAAPEPVAPALKSLAEVEHDYAVVPAGHLDKLSAKMAAIALDLDQFTDPKTARLYGVALATEAGKAIYVSCESGAPAELRRWLEREDVLKVGHDLKAIVNLLLWQGLPAEGAWHDAMLAQALVDPEQRTSFTFLSEALLGRAPLGLSAGPGNPDAAAGELFAFETPEEQQHRRNRAMERADLSFQLMTVLRGRLSEIRQERVFYDIETPLLPVLAGMERTGIKVNPGVLKDTGIKLEGQIKELEAGIHRHAGKAFNLNSPKQLGQIIFEELRLSAKPKKTKTGQYVTSEDVLTELSGLHPIINLLLEYREASKLKSTYVDALPAAIFSRTGRVHTSYLQIMTATGRLASINPNLQNIPIRTEQGRDIRRAFVPGEEGWILLSADYSQVELRVMAELSADPSMLEAFQKGEDIHISTAAKVFGVAPELVTSDMRRTAKMVNFGIIYGISAFGLSQRLGIPRGEAQRLIDQYFVQYLRIKIYMDGLIEDARKKGYVETITGRRRYLRDINSANATVRKAAERTAINTPIQGSAADMIKLAMVRISRRLSGEGFRARMLLQVHDELVFEAPSNEQESLKKAIGEEMRGALDLKTPLQVDFGSGANWKVAHA